MSRRNRPSSLPSSLIPHLYNGPQRDSSTRTTLRDDDDTSPLHLRPLEGFNSPRQPIRTDPFYYASLPPPPYHLYDQLHTEPGPSTRQEVYMPEPEPSTRREVYMPEPEPSTRRETYMPEPGPSTRREVYMPESGPSTRREVYMPEPGPSTRRENYFPEPERHELPNRPYRAQDPELYAQAGPYPYHDRLPIDRYASIRRFEPPSFEYLPRYEPRHEDPPSFERPEVSFPLAPRPIPISDYLAGPSSVPSSRPHSAGTDDNDSEYMPSQPARKRTEAASQPPPKRRLKKTPIACDFCRGRKLRCDGNRPSCINCMTRDETCRYQPHARRRGPGKAPKGSKKKQPGPTRTSNTTQRPTLTPLPPLDPSLIVFRQSPPPRRVKRSSSDEGS